MEGVSINAVVQRTGIAAGTLRMWEQRHGFPTPERLPSGHRRYSERDVALISKVVAERTTGLSLVAAIERATMCAEVPVQSVYATLRRRRPDLEPRPLSKRVLLALTHAIEDESLARAERPLLFGSFQRERFYRQAQPRWRELSRTADLAIVFADFDRVRTARGAPVEVPVDRSHPLTREWAIVCLAAEHAVCLVGWEPPAWPPDGLAQNRPTRGDAGQRVFESIWSVEPKVVAEAARICAGIAATRIPTLIERVAARLDSHESYVPRDQLRLATAITSRALSYLSSR